MDDETLRMLFGEIQTGIRDGRKELRYFRDEILELMRRQDKKVHALEQWRWKWAGALMVAAILLEVAIKAAEHLVK